MAAGTQAFAHAAQVALPRDEPERVAAARAGEAPPLPTNHSPLFAPVPKPTLQTGVTAMTLAVLSAFDRHARGNEGRVVKPASGSANCLAQTRLNSQRSRSTVSRM